MLSHSELTKMLVGLPMTSPLPLDQRISVIIRATSQGVAPEGAALNMAAAAAPRGTPVSGFKFGKKSLLELDGVIPQLVAVARLAIEITQQDFMIFDGLRTVEEQRRNVANGASRTMASKHIRQADGYGHAIDCVPVLNGIPKWDWNLIYPVVQAVDEAATNLGFADSITWGGAWDRRLSDYGGDLSAYKRECQLYADRHPGKDFLDGPHFQWVA